MPSLWGFSENFFLHASLRGHRAEKFLASRNNASLVLVAIFGTKQAISQLYVHILFKSTSNVLFRGITGCKYRQSPPLTILEDKNDVFYAIARVVREQKFCFGRKGLTLKCSCAPAIELRFACYCSH